MYDRTTLTADGYVEDVGTAQAQTRDKVAYVANAAPLQEARFVALPLQTFNSGNRASCASSETADSAQLADGHFNFSSSKEPPVVPGIVSVLFVY
jgi:hypothetical protein